MAKSKPHVLIDPELSSETLVYMQRSLREHFKVPERLPPRLLTLMNRLDGEEKTNAWAWS